MNVNRKTLDIDSIVIRQLGIKNPDNTVPVENLAVLTDGNGGTFLRNINGNTLQGFNRVFLPDTNVSTISNNANNNTLSLKGGIGVSLLLDSQKNVVFNTVPVVPSSFSFISTPFGSIYADKVQASFNMAPATGTNFSVSSNTLLIGGKSGFDLINVTNSVGTQQIAVSNTISSFTLSTGTGIDLSLINNNVIKISNKNAPAINQITLDNRSTLVFPSIFNNLNISTSGNLKITAPTASTINFEAHSFSKLVTDTNQIINAISSNDTLTLNRGRGIDYQTSATALTISLASTFANVLRAENVSTLVDQNSILNLRAGSSVVYSKTSDGAIKIDTTDFNSILLPDGNTIKSNSQTVSTAKSVSFTASGGILIQGNPTSNTISFNYTGTTPSTIGSPFTYSKVLVYSSITNISSPVSNPYIFNAAPNYSANLEIAGISPIIVTPNVNFNNSTLLYIGVDADKLLQNTSSNINSVYSTLSTSITYLNSTLSTLFLENVDYNYSHFNYLSMSSITASPSSNPLISFDYPKKRVGVNKSVRDLTNDVTLDISGTVLANIYATYSDPRLKTFTGPYTLKLSQLDVLQPSYFTWNSDKKPDIGFSANDIETILPSAVITDPNGLKLVDYSKLSIISIAALKDATKRIEALESTILSLSK